MPSPQVNFLPRRQKAYAPSSPDLRPRAKLRHAVREEDIGTIGLVGLLVSVCSGLLFLLIYALQE